MVKTLSWLSGIALLLLSIWTLEASGGSSWIGWCDLLAGVGAIGSGAAPREKIGKTGQAAGTIGIAVGLFLVWIIAYSISLTNPLVWLNFVFGLGLLVAGIIAAAEAPQIHSAVGAGALFTHRAFDREYGAAGAMPYGVGKGWPFFGLGGFYDDDWPIVSYESADYANGNYAGIGPRGYKRSDERIEEDINDGLMRHGAVDASDITVIVRDGLVTLTGSTNDARARLFAEAVAQSVMGVKEVRNELTVPQSLKGGSPEQPKSAA